jgi:hypothetical protein
VSDENWLTPTAMVDFLLINRMDDASSQYRYTSKRLSLVYVGRLLTPSTVAWAENGRNDITRQAGGSVGRGAGGSAGGSVGRSLGGCAGISCVGVKVEVGVWVAVLV